MHRRHALDTRRYQRVSWSPRCPLRPRRRHRPPQHRHYDKPVEYDAPAAPGKPLAPRLQNLGVHTFPVSTRVERAQLFMNQGINLAYAFNHAEAARAFAEAARLDPNLAMAYWGQALVLGPEHQRDDERRGRTQGIGPRAEGLGAQGQGVRRASVPISRRSRRATQARRKTGSSPIGRLPTRCGRSSRPIPTTRTRGRSLPNR